MEVLEERMIVRDYGMEAGLKGRNEEAVTHEEEENNVKSTRGCREYIYMVMMGGKQEAAALAVSLGAMAEIYQPESTMLGARLTSSAVAPSVCEWDGIVGGFHGPR